MEQIHFEILLDIFQASTNLKRTFSRLKVDGGYLYHDFLIKDETLSTCMAFVPDVDLHRYQDHLRTAYKQGYEAGHYDGRNEIKESEENIAVV